MTNILIDNGETNDTAHGESSGEAVVLDTELSEEELAAKADDDFAAGFKKVSGEEEEPVATVAKATVAPAETESDTGKGDTTGENTDEKKEAAASSEDTGKSEGDESALAKQIQSLNAKFGGLKSENMRLQKRVEELTPSSTTPTTEELGAALADPDEMKSLVERYPDFALIQTEMEHIHQRIGEVGGTQVTQAQIDAMVSRRVTESKIEDVHAGWQDTMQKPEFRAYCLAGGPPEQEFDQIAALEQAALDEPDPNRSQERFDEVNQELSTWKDVYPDWWKAKGVDIFSSKAPNTIRLFDGFEKHTKVATTDPAATKKEETNKRLQAHIKPRTTSGHVSTGVSDDDAFAGGFDRVMNNRP